jgi:hypothetical protein
MLLVDTMAKLMVEVREVWWNLGLVNPLEALEKLLTMMAMLASELHSYNVMSAEQGPSTKLLALVDPLMLRITNL